MHPFITAPRLGDRIHTMNEGIFTWKEYVEITGCFPDIHTWRLFTVAYGAMYVRFEGDKWVEVPRP